MASLKWYAHALSVNSTYFSGIQGYNISENVERSVEFHDGLPDPIFVASMAHAPGLSFRSLDVAGVLAAVDFEGVVLTELTTWWKKGKDCGTRVASATAEHAKCVATSGCAVMRTLRAAHKGRVEAEIEAFFKSSTGLADPLTWTFTSALSGTPDEFAQYTMGPVYVTPAGGSRTKITASDWEVDPGITVETESHDGVPYTTLVSITKREPKASVTTPDINHLATVTTAGVSGSIELFLRKLSQGGNGRVADATEEHIKLTLANGLLIADSASAEENGGNASLMFDGAHDGTNPVLELEFDVAIA